MKKIIIFLSLLLLISTLCISKVRYIPYPSPCSDCISLDSGSLGYVIVDGQNYKRGYLGSYYSIFGGDSCLSINYVYGYPVRIFGPLKYNKYTLGGVPFSSNFALRQWMNRYFELSGPTGDSTYYATQYQLSQRVEISDSGTTYITPSQLNDTALAIRSSISGGGGLSNAIINLDTTLVSYNGTPSTIFSYTTTTTSTLLVNTYLKVATGSCLGTFVLNWTDMDGNSQTKDLITSTPTVSNGMTTIPSIIIRTNSGSPIYITSSTIICSTNLSYGLVIYKLN